MRIGRVVSSFSLLLLAAWGWAGQYGDLDAKLKQAKTPKEKLDIVSSSGLDDPGLREKWTEATADNQDSIDALESYVDLKAMAEHAATPNQEKRIAKIKSSGLYRDEGVGDRANWLSGAIERLRNLFPQRKPTHSSRSGDFGSPAFPAFITNFVWCLLGAGLIAFIVYVIRFVNFGKLRTRRAKAMLEDDEPERTLDEWLELSSSYERDGKYREAVRALYLACLLKFDERNVARFLRSQTNWEHLARIESSPRKPAGLDFRTPTQAFDRIWYGYKVRGPIDVAEFRRWYGDVTHALQGVAA
ncbi:MAG TPA: DUF4129 domain-containing protein [Fimbriimonadaceae bacterium]|nr:DUF4129 domain-containing protein [Fimbriimonadaceae bacterium]